MKLKITYAFLFTVFLLGISNRGLAQIGINTDGSAPDASAMLDVVSTDKGVLIPRLTQIQRNAIASPATGLLVFQSDNTPGFYYYNGTTWNFVGILPTEQAAITANTAKISADGLVTTHSDVTDAGSGNIITDGERTTLGTALQSEVDGSTTNEIQTIDVSTLTGTTLNLSLSSDGEADKTVDLSSLQDGIGTDDQTAAEVANTAAGNIEATTVQAAIDELDAEKLSAETQDLEDVLGQDAAANAKITDLTDPTADQDAATKKYVDDTAVELPTAPTAGTMAYYDGSDWVSVAPGSEDQNLTFCSGVPTWGPCSIEVGDFHQGGVVFYLFQVGDAGYVAGETHGLIAAPMDQSSGIGWGCHGTDIAAVPNVMSGPSGAGAEIGDGMTNTAAIVASGCAGSNAAKLCADLSLDGFDDWFLPSAKELNLMYDNRATINTTATNNSGSTFDSSGLYWSSSENGDLSAWNQNFFFNGLQGFGVKTNFNSVRAVRAF